MKDNLNHLVRLLKQGDTSVFDELYHNTFRQVFFVILPILNDRSLAEDIMQDTYIKLLKNLQNYTENNFLAYLLTIAKNLALNEYKKRKRMTLVDEVEYDYSNYAFQNHIEISIEKEELIRDMLAILDETEKNVVLLYNVENLTHREIALILDKPLGTITWIYSKAVKKLQKKFREGDK